MCLMDSAPQCSKINTDLYKDLTCIVTKAYIAVFNDIFIQYLLLTS